MADPQPFNPYTSPGTSFAPAPMQAGSRRLQLKRVGVLSCAKIFGVLYALVALVIGGILTLVTMAGGNTGPGFGVGSIVLFTLAYGVGGILAGAFMGALYNVVAGAVGGIEMHLSDS